METPIAGRNDREEHANVEASTSSEISEEDGPDTMALEIVLPTPVAVHVRTVLSRRGIELDALVLDLLIRFVPGAAEKNPASPRASGETAVRGEGSAS